MHINVFTGGPSQPLVETIPSPDVNHVKSDSTDGCKNKLLDMPIDLTTQQEEAMKPPSDDQNALNKDEKLKQLSEKLKIKYSNDSKRKPPSFIECDMDPTIRKKPREMHPMNQIKTKTMKKNAGDPISKTEPQPDPTKNLTPIDNHIENDCVITEFEPTITDFTQVVNDDLSISDNESDTDELELNSETIASTIDDDTNQTENTAEKTSIIKGAMCSDLIPKKTKNVVINTDANTVLEYVPESLNCRDRKYPEYRPTRKTEEHRTPTVPTHQILYDLWRMVRNCDQYIGDQMETAMLHAGYLKPRY